MRLLLEFKDQDTGRYWDGDNEEGYYCDNPNAVLLLTWLKHKLFPWTKPRFDYERPSNLSALSIEDIDAASFRTPMWWLRGDEAGAAQGQAGEGREGGRL